MICLYPPVVMSSPLSSSSSSPLRLASLAAKTLLLLFLLTVASAASSSSSSFVPTPPSSKTRGRNLSPPPYLRTKLRYSRHPRHGEFSSPSSSYSSSASSSSPSHDFRRRTAARRSSPQPPSSHSSAAPTLPRTSSTPPARGGKQRLVTPPPRNKQQFAAPSPVRVTRSAPPHPPQERWSAVGTVGGEGGGHRSGADNYRRAPSDEFHGGGVGVGFDSVRAGGIGGHRGASVASGSGSGGAERLRTDLIRLKLSATMANERAEKLERELERAKTRVEEARKQMMRMQLARKEDDDERMRRSSHVVGVGTATGSGTMDPTTSVSAAETTSIGGTASTLPSGVAVASASAEPLVPVRMQRPLQPQTPQSPAACAAMNGFESLPPFAAALAANAEREEREKRTRKREKEERGVGAENGGTDSFPSLASLLASEEKGAEVVGGTDGNESFNTDSRREERGTREGGEDLSLSAFRSSEERLSTLIDERKRRAESASDGNVSNNSTSFLAYKNLTLDGLDFTLDFKAENNEVGDTRDPQEQCALLQTQLVRLHRALERSEEVRRAQHDELRASMGSERALRGLQSDLNRKLSELRKEEEHAEEKVQNTTQELKDEMESLKARIADVETEKDALAAEREDVRTLVRVFCSLTRKQADHAFKKRSAFLRKWIAEGPWTPKQNGIHRILRVGGADLREAMAQNGRSGGKKKVMAMVSASQKGARSVVQAAANRCMRISSALRLPSWRRRNGGAAGRVSSSRTAVSMRSAGSGAAESPTAEGAPLAPSERISQRPPLFSSSSPPPSVPNPPTTVVPQFMRLERAPSPTDMSWKNSNI